MRVHMAAARPRARQPAIYLYPEIYSRRESRAATSRTFPASRFSQLARDRAIECGVLGLTLLFQRKRRELDRVQDVAEVKLGYFRDGFVRAGLRPIRHPVRPCGMGVTSPVMKRVSAVITFTTIAVMLSIPPLLFASAIIAFTIRSGVARD